MVGFLFLGLVEEGSHGKPRVRARHGEAGRRAGEVRGRIRRIRDLNEPGRGGMGGAAHLGFIGVVGRREERSGAEEFVVEDRRS